MRTLSMRIATNPCETTAIHTSAIRNFATTVCNPFVPDHFFNTENQRFQVTGVQDHPTFWHVFVPHMAKTTTGETYCTLYGRNDTDKADYALQWKQDISHVQTLCDVDSSPHEVQKDVGVFCRQIHSNKTSALYMDKG